MWFPTQEKKQQQSPETSRKSIICASYRSYSNHLEWTQAAAGLMLQHIKSMADDGYVQLYWPRPLPHSHRARLNKRLLKATRIRDGVMSPGALDWDNWAPTQASQSSFDVQACYFCTSLLHLAPSIHPILQYSCSITLIKCTCSAGILIRGLYFTSQPIFIYF